MNEKRKPAAFRLSPEPEPRREANAARPGEHSRRKPVAVRSDAPVVHLDEIDIFDIDDTPQAPPPALPARRGLRLGGIFTGALGILLSLAIGLWVDDLVRGLFARAGWLGWTALAAAAAAALTLLVILLRELRALLRLASVDRLQRRAAQALASADAAMARSLVDDLSRFVAERPQTAAGRRNLAELRGDVIDGPDLIRLAETELLAPLDRAAQKLVLDAGKRVSVVTAVSPRAAVDLVYVLFESARLIRRISELYGARPGAIGFVRLARNVVAHLAVTGSIAAGDSLIQQIVGHGVAARLSAKLGEGVINGMMTVRIGIAAMETARPLPFAAVERPGMGKFLSALASFSRSKEAEDDTAGR